MYKLKGLRPVLVSVVLIIATLVTATVFTACDGISDPDSNFSASAVTDTPAGTHSPVPTAEPTPTQADKTPQPTPTPVVTRTPDPTPVATRTPNPTPIRTTPPGQGFGDYAEYREYMLDVLYGERTLDKVVSYSNVDVLVHKGDRLFLYDSVEWKGADPVEYNDFICELPVGLIEYANEVTYDQILITGSSCGIESDETIYAVILFDNCIAIQWGMHFAGQMYFLIGSDDGWKTYYQIKSPADCGIVDCRVTAFNIYEDGTMFYGTYYTTYTAQMSYSVDRGENWAMCEINMPKDVKYIEIYSPGKPVFDGENGILPLYATFEPWDLEYYVLIFTTEDGGKTWTFSEELSL